ncbi:cytidylyltransferase domain-containing protein [Cohnella silvisoli]|uniref:Glycosyltransferase family protein n=1 Tax=Cohnella silvisoli TaxID=2873699 RepID=A0ABV1KW04_9BACL|nr:glycosyltransferase family protein [Cohnella silvisoli]MCD9023668.1 glycosyltransferase family protein [Cohnella silvisoli]
MKVAIIIQARMGSSRLPGKVLRMLDGITVLQLIHERLSYCRHVHEIVVATSDSEKDDAVAAAMERLNIAVYRGQENDVLDRYYRAASIVKADAVVRITGDCPLIDPQVVDAVIGKYLEQFPQLHYVSNIHPPTFPDGLDVEVFSYVALERAWKEARQGSEREHVTPYIHSRPDLFPQANMESRINYSHLRWTLDEEKDYIFLNALIEKAQQDEGLSPRTASLEQWVEILRRYPDLNEINNGILRNEGLEKSKLFDSLAAQ